MRIRKGVILITIFFLIGVLSRALFASKDFTHMDGVLYAVGTFDYSVKNDTPPSPGYFLYVMSAKLLNFIFADPHDSLMFLSIVYSGLIAGILYYFGTLIKNRTTGIISATLFLTSPLFWYKGITIFGYLNAGFFILLTALLGYKIVAEKKRTLILWFSFCLAILIGVRPQELLVIIPLYVFILFYVKPKEAVYSIIVFLIICLLWLIPLIIMSGGISTYISSLLSRSDLIDDSIFSGNPMSKLNNHLVRMGQYFVWAYFLGAIPLVYYIGRFFYLPNFTKEKKMQFFAVWIVPTVLYNIFIQFGEIGHGMSWGLGILLILGESIAVLCEDVLRMLRLQNPYWKSTVFTLILIPIVLTNFFMFFYDLDKGEADFYSFKRYRQFNYTDVNKNNRFLMSKVNYIKENFNPQNILIISSGVFSHQVMFRLPKVIVIQPSIIYKKDNFGFCLFKDYKRSYYMHKIDFIVPKGISKLILFDDIFSPYLQGKRNAVPFAITDAYKLLALDVSEGQRLIFDYHSIRIE